MQGSFADLDPEASCSAEAGPGVMWMEALEDGFLSSPQAVLVADDPLIVDEINSLVNFELDGFSPR